jgi:hypothetical protein
LLSVTRKQISTRFLHVHNFLWTSQKPAYVMLPNMFIIVIRTINSVGDLLREQNCIFMCWSHGHIFIRSGPRVIGVFIFGRIQVCLTLILLSYWLGQKDTFLKLTVKKVFKLKSNSLTLAILRLIWLIQNRTHSSFLQCELILCFRRISFKNKWEHDCNICTTVLRSSTTIPVYVMSCAQLVLLPSE